MKALLLLLLSTPAMAFYSITVTASGGSPIPTAYSASNSQSKLTNGNKFSRNLAIINQAGDKICVNFVNGSPTTAPSSGDSNELCLPSGATAQMDDGTIGPADVIYLRSNSGGTITSGYVTFFIW